MTDSPDRPPILEYSRPARRRGVRGSLPAWGLSLAFCLFVAIYLAVLSYSYARMPDRTPAFAAYVAAADARRESQPGYVPPRFVGAMYARPSPWRSPLTYASLAMFGVSAAVVVAERACARRRRRRRE